MCFLLSLLLAIATATASVIPPYGYGPGWDDYGVHPHHHHVPVATSYASVWKVDHSVPVVVKPVAAPAAPWWGTDPAWDPHAAWALPHHHHHDPYGYGPHY